MIDLLNISGNDRIRELIKHSHWNDLCCKIIPSKMINMLHPDCIQKVCEAALEKVKTLEELKKLLETAQCRNRSEEELKFLEGKLDTNYLNCDYIDQYWQISINIKMLSMLQERIAQMPGSAL